MLLRVALALLIPVCIAAQDAAGEKPRAWGKVSGSYQLSIASDKAQYEMGEPIEIASILKNVSDHAIMLLRTFAETNYVMEVLMPAQSWLPWRSRAALMPYGNKVKNPEMNNVAGADIPPGREVEDKFKINKIYDMSAPGDYLITFQCRQSTIRIGDMDGKEHPMVDIMSNAITVTVLPKP
ncbi:MAG: hypothetical protein ABSG03_34875 [Bryobacteraceae bacterium]|jgi:hypothetical protein